MLALALVAYPALCVYERRVRKRPQIMPMAAPVRGGTAVGLMGMF